MKKEKLFLALLTAAMTLPATLPITPVLAQEVKEEMDDSTLTNVDDSKQGSLSIQIGNKTFKNTTDLSLDPISYSGSEIKPKVKVTWTSGEKSISLVENSDFTITWKNNKNIGLATGELQFIGAYRGAKRNIKFNIQRLSLVKATIQLNQTTYSLDSNMDKIEPKVSVKVGNLTLDKDTDYTLSYSNNDKVGTGTVIITGKGNFEGSVSKTFTITGIRLSVEKTPKEITTASGDLKAEEKKILQEYLNENSNQYNYDYIVEKASIQRDEEKAEFEMALSAKLKDESLINLTFTGLKSSSEDALVEEEFLEFSDLEEETFFEYAVISKDGQKVTIQGIPASQAFRVNGKINSTNIRNILLEAGYKVSNLDFSSAYGKESKFAINNFKTPISIAITTSKKVTQTPAIDVPLPSTPSQPSIPMVVETVKKAVYRFFNPLTGEHFYTSSEAERDQLMADSRWNCEGQAWSAPDSSDYLIYRVCNPNTGEHHFTMDKNEYETLQTRGWIGEGVGFYSANPSDENVVHLYRLYNPKAKDAGSHHYTMSEEERDALVKDGWNYEGVAWYGIK